MFYMFIIDKYFTNILTALEVMVVMGVLFYHQFSAIHRYVMLFMLYRNMYY